MASKKNPILNLVGGLLGGVGSGDFGADKKVKLPDVVKVTNKFGESMERFLDTEYAYIQYLRNRNCGGLGVGGLDGQRGSKRLIDYSREKKRFKWGSGELPLPYRSNRTKVKTNRGLKGWFQNKYSRWMEHRSARKFNQGLAKKFKWDRNQIKAFRDARAKGHPWQQARNIANATPKNPNLITRSIHGFRDMIPNRPTFLTRKEWRFLRPGVRERLLNLITKKEMGQGPNKSLQPRTMPKFMTNMRGAFSIKNLNRMFAGLGFGLDLKERVVDKGQDTWKAIVGAGASTWCAMKAGGVLATKGAVAGGSVGGPWGAAIGGLIGGIIGGVGGAMACGGIADTVTGANKTDKKKFGGLVNGAAQCTDCASTSKHSGGAVINSPTRGVLGGQKTLIGEAQEPELILPMSKIGDALSAVYREGASVMVGATISFLTPLSASPAVASVLGEARKLQSIVGTSDIEAETPKVPEIKQINVKASNNETNNMEKKFNSGGFVTGGTGIDKVPARLTAGEFVMSKGAVKRFGAGTLASMNAAGGGTNRPTPSGGYNQGGKSFDRSHYGTEGYQIGQINPPTLILSREEFKEHTTDSNKKRNWLQKNITQRDYEKFTEYEGPILGKTRTKLETRDGNLVSTQTYESDIVSIGVPDLYAHKDQLLSAIHAVPGYGHVTIQDVINSKVGMPLKQYMMILMTSDAQAATFAKKDAAHQADLELRGIDPSKGGYSMGYDFNGGGLVPPAISPSATSNIKPRSKKNFESVNQAPVVQAKKARVKSVILPVPQYIPQVVTRTVVQEVPVAKLGSLVISDQGKGVKIVS